MALDDCWHRASALAHLLSMSCLFKNGRIVILLYIYIHALAWDKNDGYILTLPGNFTTNINFL